MSGREDKKKVAARRRKAKYTLNKKKSEARKMKAKKYRESVEGKRKIQEYERNSDRKERKAAYDASDKRKVQKAVYNASEIGKEQKLAYNASDKGKAKNESYNASAIRKEQKLAYDASAKGKLRKQAYEESERGKLQRRSVRKSNFGVVLTNSSINANLVSHASNAFALFQDNEGDDHNDQFINGEEANRDLGLYYDSSFGSDSDNSFSSGSSGSSETDGSASVFEDYGEEDKVPKRGGIGDCGDMFKYCVYCGAIKLKPFQFPCRSPGELNLYAMCCKKGKIYLNQQHPSPSAEYFYDLWSSDDEVGRVFRKYSRKINNAFSLASFVASEVEMGGFNPNYKVRGKGYVMLGALIPGNADVPKFSQIYVYDADDDTQRLDIRMNHVKLEDDIPD